MTESVTIKRMFLCLFCLWAAVPALAIDIAFNDLKTQAVHLPYGQPFTVSGTTGDIRIGNQKLTDVITPETIGGKYTADGKDTPINPEPVNGEAWKVTIGELKPDTSVTFTFQFSGKLTDAAAGDVVRAAIESPDFMAVFGVYLEQTKGKSASEYLAPASMFGDTVSRLVLGELGKRGLSPKSERDFARTLFSPVAIQFSALANLPTTFEHLRNPGDPEQRIPGLDATFSLGQVYDKLSHIQQSDLAAIPADRSQNVKNSIALFLKQYGVLTAGLKDAVVAGLTVSAGTDAADVVSDLQKYAGFDVGALYAPQLNELRSFFTANIYFKPVELRTDDWSIWQRLSLTLGASIGDLSGRDTNKTRISGDNAFVYGLGFRLNKYFRLTVGGMLYRLKLPSADAANPADNSLKHAFFFGPSLDITALPGLTTIFAKAKGGGQ